MRTKESAATLLQAVKDLSLEWEQTKSYWHDLKSQEFQEQYITKLPDYVAQAMAAMEEIDALLRKVRSDCE